VTRLWAGRWGFNCRCGQWRGFLLSSPSRPDRPWGTPILLPSG